MNITVEIISKIVRRAASSSWPTAVANWRGGMRQDNWLLYPLISGGLYLYLVPDAFELGFLTGLGFVAAGASAIYNGFIFRHPVAIVFVYVGVIVSSQATGLLFPAYQSASTGDWISGVVLLGAAVGIWIWAQRMKQVDDEWEPGVFSEIRAWIDRFKDDG